MKCGGNHFLSSCDDFVQLSISDRWNFIRAQGACWNCFNMGHAAQECSRVACRFCGKKHHGQLHHHTEHSPAPPETKAMFSAVQLDAEQQFAEHFAIDSHPQPDTISESHVLSFGGKAGNDLLMTMKVLAHPSTPKPSVETKLVMDPGSTTNFVDEETRQNAGALKVSERWINLSVFEAESPERVLVEEVVTLIGHKTPTSAVKINCLVRPYLARNPPAANHPDHIRSMPHLDGLPLADDEFWKSEPVGILIGCRTFLTMFLGTIRGPLIPHNGPTAFLTLFGYVLLGAESKRLGPVDEIIQNFVRRRAYAAAADSYLPQAGGACGWDSEAVAIADARVSFVCSPVSSQKHPRHLDSPPRFQSL